MFLVSPYSLKGPCSKVQNCTFVVVQEYSAAYVPRKEAVKLFMFLLLPYSLTGTCQNVQECGFRSPAKVECLVNIRICNCPTIT
jgi:hypothetical protein